MRDKETDKERYDSGWFHGDAHATTAGMEISGAHVQLQPREHEVARGVVDDVDLAGVEAGLERRMRGRRI